MQPFALRFFVSILLTVPAGSLGAIGSAGTEMLVLTGAEVTADTTIRENAPTENFGSGGHLYFNHSAGSRSYALMRFEGIREALPSGATVTRATLRVRLETGNRNYEVRAYALNVPWDEGTAARVAQPDDGSTWVQRLGDGTGWGVPGLEAATDRSREPIATELIASSGVNWSSLDITDLVGTWADGEPNFGLLLTTSKKVYATSSDNDGGAYHPQLVIEYASAGESQAQADQEPAGGNSASASPAPDDGSVLQTQAPRITSVSATPNPLGTHESTSLGAQIDDPDQNSLHFQWRKSSGPGQVTFDAASSQSAGAQFSVAGSYQLQLTVTDGFDRKDSAIVSVTVEDAHVPSVGAVDRSGTILADETWSGTVYVSAATKLKGRITVTAGSRIVLPENEVLQVATGGFLSLQGTASQPIQVEARSGTGFIDIRGGRGSIRFARLKNVHLNATHLASSSNPPPLLVFEDNVLTGQLSTYYQAVVIKRNYIGIHGRFATGSQSRPYKGAAPGSEIIDNVFNGGTWITGAMGGLMRGNVFVSEVVPGGAEVDDYTHEHMIGVVPGSLIERNIFVGASHAAIMPLGLNNGSHALIRNNTIDHRGAGQCVLFHAAKGDIGGMVLRNNLCIRAWAGAKDEQSTPDAVGYADYNLFADVGDAYQQIVMTDKSEGSSGYGLHDITVGDPRAVVTSPDLGYPYPFSQAQMLDGEVSVRDALNFYREAYKPKSGSPAIDAGSPTDATDPAVEDGRIDIGAVERSGPDA